MDRRPPGNTKPDIVLQPRWPPRLGFSLALVVMSALAVWAAVAHDSLPVVGWLGLGVAVVFFIRAWVERVIIIGPVLYHQGALRWYPALRAEDVEEVTLYYDPGRIDFFRRVLRMVTRDGRAQTFSIRWWNWPELVAWLTRYCTRIENDQIVWAIKTDEKTRSRLEPYARRHLPGPPLA